MNSHGVGGIQGTRQGCYPIKHTFKFSPNPSGGGATTFTLAVIDGSELRPQCFRVTARVQTAYTNTGIATLSAGVVGAGFTDILNAVDIKAAAGTTYEPATTNAYEYTEAKTPVKVIITTGDDDGVGEVLVDLEVWDVNVIAVEADE